MNNAILLIDLLIKLGARFQAGMAVLRQAQAEGRDVTDAELDAASAEYDATKAAVLAQLGPQEGSGG